MNAKRPWHVIGCTLLLALLGIGLATVRVESNLYKLWIESDSRLHAERDYTDKYFAETSTRTEYLLVVPKAGTEDKATGSIVTENHLNELLFLSESIHNLTVTMPNTKDTPASIRGKTFGHRDICGRPRQPDALLPLSGGLTLAGVTYDPFDLPCTRYNPLDCFREGGFDFEVPDLTPLPWDPQHPNVLAAVIHAGLVPASTPNPLPNRYVNRPTFRNRTTAQLHQLIKGSCKVWADVLLPMNIMFGGVQRKQTFDADGKATCDLSGYGCDVSSVSSLETTWEILDKGPLARRMCLKEAAVDPDVDAADCQPDTIAASRVSDAEAIVTAWEADYIKMMERLAPQMQYVQVRFFAERTTDDLVGEANAADVGLIAAGYVLMIAFASLTRFRMSWQHSRVLSTTIGVFWVVLSVVSGLGLTALVGIPFSPTILQVLPFLGLGLGVSDMFVLADSFHFVESMTVEEMTIACMREAGTSVTLSSMCNFIAFMVGGTIPLPSVSTFSLAAGLSVFLNYFINIFGFVSVMVLDARRQKNGKRDCLPCFNIPGAAVRTTTVGHSGKAGSPGGAGSDADLPGHAHTNEFVRKYADILMMTPVRIFVIVGFAALLGVGINYATQAEDGLPLGDIVPASHYSASFLSLRERDYGDFPASLVIGMDFDGKAQTLDWVDTMPTIFAMEDALQKVSGVNPTLPVWALSWLDNFIIALNFQYRAYNQTLLKECAPPLGSWHAGCEALSSAPCTLLGTPDPTCSYLQEEAFPIPNLYFYSVKPLYNSINPAVPSSGPFYSMDPTKYAGAVVRLPTKDKFIQLLDTFLGSPEGVSYTTQIAFTDTKPHTVQGVEITFLQTQLFTVELLEKHIFESRAALDPFTPHAFPSGFVYSFYEQYIHVRQYLKTSVIYTAIAVTGVSLLFLFHPGITLILICTICSSVACVYGYLHPSNLKVNGVTVVNIIMGIGVTIEFTAFICRAFLVAQGTRVQRVKQSLYAMFMPVLYGGIATFLGVILMIDAKFPYFKLYFFDMYVLIIVIGCGHGMVLLPVILSFIGPDTVRLEKDAPLNTNAQDSSAPAAEPVALKPVRNAFA